MNNLKKLEGEVSGWPNRGVTNDRRPYWQESLNRLTDCAPGHGPRNCV
jgi:hypothetical protein